MTACAGSLAADLFMKASSDMTVSLGNVNALSTERFVELLGGVFEHAPWVALEAAGLRPFQSVAGLHEAMFALVTAADREQRLSFLRGHPDLAGAAFRAGSVTAESAGEQTGASLDRLTAEIKKNEEVQRAEAKEPRRESSPQNAHNPKTVSVALRTSVMAIAICRTTIQCHVKPRTTAQQLRAFGIFIILIIFYPNP